jgi:hypothetical protein
MLKLFKEKLEINNEEQENNKNFVSLMTPIFFKTEIDLLLRIFVLDPYIFCISETKIIKIHQDTKEMTT